MNFVVFDNIDDLLNESISLKENVIIDFSMEYGVYCGSGGMYS